MFRSATLRSLKWLWEQLDTVLALLIAAICGVFGFIGVAKESILTSAILGTLTVLAFALMRDRNQRDKLGNRLSQIAEPTADLFFQRAIPVTPLLQEAERE